MVTIQNPLEVRYRCYSGHRYIFTNNIIPILYHNRYNYKYNLYLYNTQAMSLVRLYNKKTKTTYVYESESYWDPDKQQPRNRRRLIGRIDPATGEIVPTGRPGRRPASSGDAADVPDRVAPEQGTRDTVGDIIGYKNLQISQLKDRIRELELRCSRYEQTLDRIRSLADPDRSR